MITDKNRLIAAFEYLKQASILLSPFNIEVSKTLKELSDWIVETYQLSEEDIHQFNGIIMELMNG